MKSVVVIGATQGTGRELAAEYARRGASVVITGRSAERAAQVADELSTGRRSPPLRLCDLDNMES